MGTLRKIQLRLRCLYLRFRYRKELFTLVFSEFIPDLGEIITDANGTQIMIVETGSRDGNTWVAKGYVVYVPDPQGLPMAIALDFIEDTLPEGTPLFMNGDLWVKIGTGEYIPQYLSQTYQA